MVRIGILGAAGYTGGELIRVLLGHPEAKIVFANSESNAGNPVCEVHEGLIGETDLCFTSEMTGESIYPAKEYKQDFCKYICTYKGTVISAGYLCYYRDLFTFNGVQEGGWVEFMIRETDTNWEVPVWTCSFNVVEDDSGYVHERHTEYYSRRR